MAAQAVFAPPMVMAAVAVLVVMEQRRMVPMPEVETVTTVAP
jgi:hypothetical protein